MGYNKYMKHKNNSTVSYLPLILIAAVSIASIYFINNRLTEKTNMSSNGSVNSLSKNDIVVGTGTEALKGSKVKVLYTGSLLSDSSVFDQNQNKDNPFSFTLGAGSVIAGWDQGIEGMKVGGKRELLIPPDLAYGDNGAGDKIPPKASLKFVVELISVE
jgi:FKBP-type peptidyl-prolyl cis-trans isomerase